MAVIDCHHHVWWVAHWPVVLLSGGFQQVWSGIGELCAKLSASERSAVLGGTAERIYGI